MRAGAKGQAVDLTLPVQLGPTSTLHFGYSVFRNGQAAPLADQAAHCLVVLPRSVERLLHANGDPILERARHFLGDRPALGRRVRFSGAPASAPNPWMTIVGVVGDVRAVALGASFGS